MEERIEEKFDTQTDIVFEYYEDPLFDQNQVEKVEITLYGERAFYLKNAMTKKECQFYIDQMERIGLTHVDQNGYASKYRNNERVMGISDEIARLIFDRIKPFLQDQIVIDNSNAHQFYQSTQGTWKPSFCNHLIRMCKYNQNGHFAPHFDGEFFVSSLKRSLKTVMFYLNSNFTGGSTNFICQDQKMFQDESGKFRAEESNVLHKLIPEEGMVLVFDHRILHEGDTVQQGVKYILRTELVYQCVSRTVSEDEEKIQSLIQLAQNEEAFGRVEKAVEYYKQARKINPDIASQWGI